MNKNIKKISILATIFSAFMMITSTSIFAADLNAISNDALKDLLTGSTISGKVIKLNNDINLGEDTINISESTIDAVIDLNGYKITSMASNTINVNLGKLVINDSKTTGLIENKNSYGNTIKIIGGNVTINNGEFKGKNHVLNIVDNTYNGNYNDINVTINNGKFISTDEISIFFENNHDSSVQLLTINGGEFSGYTSLFFYKDDAADITLKGGKFVSTLNHGTIGALYMDMAGATRSFDAIIPEGYKLSSSNCYAEYTYISTDKEIEILKQHAVANSNTNTVTVTADKQKAFKGDKVTLTLGNIPNGYKLKKLSVKRAVFSDDAIVTGDSEDVENLQLVQGTLTYEDVALAADNSFTMPDGIVLVKAELEKIEEHLEKDETPKTGMNFLDYIFAVIKF